MKRVWEELACRRRLEKKIPNKRYCSLVASTESMGGNATWWEKQDRNKSTRAMPCLQPHIVASLKQWNGITAAHCLASGLQHQCFGAGKVMPFQGWTSVNHCILGTVWVLS